MTEFFLLSASEPGIIVGPIARGLGVFYNAIFDGLYGASPAFALGLAIIIFTLIIKGAFFPLSYYQVKSTRKMAEIQPKLNAIQAKYKGKTDRDSQIEMRNEMNKVQKESGANMLAGCLPLLVQLPILWALFQIFQQPYMYLNEVAQLYNEIAAVFLEVPAQLRVDVLYNIAVEHKMEIDLAIQSDLVKLINSMTMANWDTVLFGFSEYTALAPLYEEKLMIESFFGISMIYKTGARFPGIVIPILSGLTTWLSTKETQKAQPTDPNNPMGDSMKTMNVVMPVILGIMTATVPAGVGIYWTISNLFQLLSHKIINKLMETKAKRTEAAERAESVRRAEEAIRERERLKQRQEEFQKKKGGKK
ncbi:MAG: membrane protein insertase YidC [Firmicutes bacterium]|nr:membrane protein insertase YidC [Bacillota bacterium]